MYYLVGVDHNGMAALSPEVNVTGFKKCCLSNAVDGTNDMLWNGSEEDGNEWCACEEDEGNDCEDGESDNDCMKCVKLIVKYFS
jgi:hypothetical protein